MAYLREIDELCSCGKRATVELRNRFNSSHGKYCRKCGDAALKRLQKLEQDQR